MIPKKKPRKAAKPSAANKTKAKRHSSRFARYEELKASITANATTPDDYMAACRRAAQLAGV